MAPQIAPELESTPIRRGEGRQALLDEVLTIGHAPDIGDDQVGHDYGSRLFARSAKRWR